MNWSIRKGGEKSRLTSLSFMQNKQASAIMDSIGRLIPIEGVDYNVEIIFSADNASSVSMNITAMTDKGEWWRRYVMEMFKKYPPTIDAPGEPLPYYEETKSSHESQVGDSGEPQEAKDESVVS